MLIPSYDGLCCCCQFQQSTLSQVVSRGCQLTCGLVAVSHARCQMPIYDCGSATVLSEDIDVRSTQYHSRCRFCDITHTHNTHIQFLRLFSRWSWVSRLSLHFPSPSVQVLSILLKQIKTFHNLSNAVTPYLSLLSPLSTSICLHCCLFPSILHLASSEQWCWSGGRGILTELSLCQSWNRVSGSPGQQFGPGRVGSRVNSTKTWPGFWPGFLFSVVKHFSARHLRQKAWTSCLLLKMSWRLL